MLNEINDFIHNSCRSFIEYSTQTKNVFFPLHIPMVNLNNTSIIVYSNNQLNIPNLEKMVRYNLYLESQHNGFKYSSALCKQCLEILDYLRDYDSIDLLSKRRLVALHRALEILLQDVFARAGYTGFDFTKVHNVASVEFKVLIQNMKTIFDNYHGSPILKQVILNNNTCLKNIFQNSPITLNMVKSEQVSASFTRNNLIIT